MKDWIKPTQHPGALHRAVAPVAAKPKTPPPPPPAKTK